MKVLHLQSSKELQNGCKEGVSKIFYYQMEIQLKGTLQFVELYL